MASRDKEGPWGLLPEAASSGVVGYDAKLTRLAGLSHEIRTPLNAVVGLCNLLQNQNLPAQKQQEFLRSLQLSSQHLLLMMNELFTLVKSEKPAAPAPQETAAITPRHLPLERHTGDTGKMQVLLVEDYWANVLVATAILDNLGYHYEVAENGKDAVQRFSSQHFDVVLMDVQMPEMDGIAATRAIRDWEKKQPLALHRRPIIGMTAHALKGDRERCLNAGMDDYISKPFQPHELEEKLRQYCPDRQVA